MLKKEEHKKILLNQFSKYSLFFKDEYDEIQIKKNDILRSMKFYGNCEYSKYLGKLIS